MRRWHSALLVAAAGALASCTDAGEAPRVAAAPITNGALDTGDAHVVALIGRRALCGETGIPSCTGTLIASRVVLTAAHCVEGVGADGLEVFLGSNVGEGGETIYVEEVAIHPAWNESTRENDIALVLLRVPVEVDPPPLLAAMDGSFIGTEARLVGFGSPEAGVAPGVKRSGVARISSLDPGTFWIVPSPAMSCQGDSGGPVFVTVGDTEYLAGITSSGDVDCAELGINTRVDVSVDDFITPYLQAVDANPGAPDAGPPRSDPIDVCAQTCSADQECPEDTTCTLHDGEFRCSAAGLPHGFFAGEVCSGECDCAEGWCVAIDRGGRSECGCYTLCEPWEGPGAKSECDDGGCGCAASPAPRPGWLALLFLCVAVLRRRCRAPCGRRRRQSPRYFSKAL